MMPQVWKRHVEESTEQPQVESQESQAKKFTRDFALQEYSMCSAKPCSVWSPMVIVGHYLLQYEAKHQITWEGNKKDFKKILQAAVQLIERYGVEKAYLAIEAVFSEKMRWVMFPDSILLSEQNFQRYVVPVMTQIREKNKSFYNATYTYGEPKCECAWGGK
jgi:uroporphyrinogen-III decarboxylase